MLAQHESIVFPGVYDALSALLAKRAGFELAFLSGYGMSASHLGLPDMGFLGQSDVADVAGRVCVAAGLPLIVDADTGYGNELNVGQTVSRLLRAGAKGCFLEDQCWPKRCGHMAGKEVVDRDEFAAKLAAAVAAKGAADFFIVARTDAVATDGVDEALARMRLAEEAGVDGFFIEAPPDADTLRRIGAEAPRPLVANLIEGGKTPVLRQEELQGLGFSLLLYPLTALYSATKAVGASLAKLRRNGTSDPRDLASFAEFNELIGADELLRGGGPPR
ncbi:MAG: isocitrate lyase/PEP mutase family protein [Betaproteobacteria bacterium AqS2]|uniref:Isocitrate lyase/PEP mutase family protein n=1 Tax=Candidatus Amphirhobacter heronislandensis TaxID=1732024 RepID=A0A930UHW4_9GAMM|nr:isocitrate lyase/PEP mutase family protein [Betaproteobacteria bacterium AqS2]